MKLLYLLILIFGLDIYFLKANSLVLESPSEFNITECHLTNLSDQFEPLFVVNKAVNSTDSKCNILNLAYNVKRVLHKILRLQEPNLLESWIESGFHQTAIASDLLVIYILTGFNLHEKISLYFSKSTMQKVWLSYFVCDVPIFEYILISPHIQSSIVMQAKKSLEEISLTPLTEMFYDQFKNKLDIFYKIYRKWQVKGQSLKNEDPQKYELLKACQVMLKKLEERRPSPLSLRKSLEGYLEIMEKEKIRMAIELKNIVPNHEANLINDNQKNDFQESKNRLEGYIARIHAFLMEKFSMNQHTGIRPCSVTKRDPISYCEYMVIKNFVREIDVFLSLFQKTTTKDLVLLSAKEKMTTNAPVTLISRSPSFDDLLDPSAGSFSRITFALPQYSGVKAPNVDPFETDEPLRADLERSQSEIPGVET